MEHDPRASPYVTSDHLSFAYASVKDRWPVIVTGAIDDVHRSLASSASGEKEAEGKAIIEGLSKLKYEIQHDRKLTPLEDDGYPDVKDYNDELQQRGPPNWCNVSWLYAECYLYRRIATLFAKTKYWKNYDIFSRQKISTFRSSRPAVVELASKYEGLMKQLESPKSTDQSPEEAEAAERLLFSEMCEICLWGNATDLSLLTNLSYEDIQKLQGSSARKAAEANILVNDLPAAFTMLKKAQKENPKGERRIDIVLDNAGFELFVDLVLAGYLIAAGLATSIVLHPKNIPWFVSDVVPADFAALLNALADPQAFYSSPTDSDNGKTPEPLSDAEVASLQSLFTHWSTLHGEGQLAIRPNRFWTQAGSYWRLPSNAPDLYEDLRESELVIFKGDLNYRKLTGDVAWPATTPFAEAIGPLAEQGNGLRVLALRTCKADVVVGLAEGVDEKISKTEGGGGDSGARKWAWSGKWAVVSYSDGRDGRA